MFVPRLPVITLVVSLLVHGGVLWYPLATKKTSSESESVDIQVVRLPKPSPQPQVSVAVAKPVPLPQKTAVVRRHATVQTAQKPQPKRPAAAPVASQTTSQPARSQAASTTQPTSTSDPLPPTDPPPNLKPNDLLVDLGRLPGTTACNGVKGCWKSDSSQWRSVYQDVRQQISEQGYEVTELDVDDDTGFRVCKISKDGDTKYFLHLLSNLQGTVYVLNPTQLERQELEEKVNAATSAGAEALSEAS